MSVHASPLLAGRGRPAGAPPPPPASAPALLAHVHVRYAVLVVDPRHGPESEACVEALQVRLRTELQWRPGPEAAAFQHGLLHQGTAMPTSTHLFKGDEGVGWGVGGSELLIGAEGGGSGVTAIGKDGGAHVGCAWHA